MEGTANPSPTPEAHRPLACADAGQSSPFSRQWVTITKQEHIDLAAEEKRCPTCGLRHLPTPALFEPVLEALYCKQMSERLFHNDETRWDVFAEIEGKVGTRWFLRFTLFRLMIFLNMAHALSS